MVWTFLRHGRRYWGTACSSAICFSRGSSAMHNSKFWHYLYFKLLGLPVWNLSSTSTSFPLYSGLRKMPGDPECSYLQAIFFLKKSWTEWHSALQKGSFLTFNSRSTYIIRISWVTIRFSYTTEWQLLDSSSRRDLYQFYISTVLVYMRCYIHRHQATEAKRQK